MKVCRVCLASDIKLFDLENYNLKVSYETLTNSLLTEDGLPRKLCWECRSRLLSCVRFRAKALCSQALLTTLAPFNQYNIIKKLESIDRHKLHLASSLSCTRDMNHIELDARDSASATEQEAGESPRWALAGAAGCSVSDWEHVRVKQEREWDGVSAENERDGLCYAEHEFKFEVELDPGELQSPDHSFDRVQQVEEPVLKTTHNLQNTFEAKPTLKTAIEESNPAEKDLETPIRSQTGSHALATSSIKHIANGMDNVNIDLDYKCIESYIGNTDLKTRKKSHAREKPYKCDNCEYEAAKKNYLKEHILSVHAGEKPFECSHCSYRSSRKSHLLTHQRTHTGEKPYKCSHCSYTTGVKSCLVKHERTHTGEKPYKCDICDYKATQKVSLNEHLLNAHSDEKPFKCSHCSYTCSRKAHLLSHHRTHTGDKPYKCSHCSYTCSAKSYLLCHQRTHTGEKPFKCSDCSYTTSFKSSLVTHQRTHTGEKPYKCDMCDYKAAHTTPLKRHIVRKHAGEKPYTCNICSYRGAGKSDFKNHMKIHNVQSVQ